MLRCVLERNLNRNFRIFQFNTEAELTFHYPYPNLRYCWSCKYLSCTCETFRYLWPQTHQMAIYGHLFTDPLLAPIERRSESLGATVSFNCSLHVLLSMFFPRFQTAWFVFYLDAFWEFFPPSIVIFDVRFNSNGGSNRWFFTRFLTLETIKTM